MTSKLLAAAVVAALGSPALAQYGTTPPPTPPPAYPPAAAPPSAPSQYGQQPSQYGQQPSQYPQQPAPSPPAQQPAATAPPATSGASQQVVVNPPATAPAAPPAQAPAQTAPSSAPAQVTVNPPAQAPAPAQSTVILDRGERRAQTVVVGDEARPQRNPMAVVATNALYGGAAGAVVGVGVALIEGDNWVRDVTVGAGLGVLAGAVVGGITAYGDQGGDRIARDGFGTPARDKDKQRPMRPVAGYAFRW